MILDMFFMTCPPVTPPPHTSQPAPAGFEKLDGYPGVFICVKVTSVCYLYASFAASLHCALPRCSRDRRAIRLGRSWTTGTKKPVLT